MWRYFGISISFVDIETKNEIYCMEINNSMRRKFYIILIKSFRRSLFSLSGLFIYLISFFNALFKYFNHGSELKGNYIFLKQLLVEI